MSSKMFRKKSLRRENSKEAEEYGRMGHTDRGVVKDIGGKDRGEDCSSEAAVYVGGGGRRGRRWRRSAAVPPPAGRSGGPRAASGAQ